MNDLIAGWTRRLPVAGLHFRSREKHLYRLLPGLLDRRDEALEFIRLRIP